MQLLRWRGKEGSDVSCPLGDEWRITNDESMMNDENLGSAGASPALFGAAPKSFRWCPARRVTQRAGRLRSPLIRVFLIFSTEIPRLRSE
jgi:hypothetical protein